MTTAPPSLPRKSSVDSAPASLRGEPRIAPLPLLSFVSQGEGLIWLGQTIGGLILVLAAKFAEDYDHIAGHPLLLMFFGLALLAALLPASGPRGQRVGLLPGIGLASALLLPPLTATLPLLVANVLHAATRETSAERRGVIERGAWLTLATLVAGFSIRLTPTAEHSLGRLITLTIIYTLVYLIGHLIGLRHGKQNISVWKQFWNSGRLEIAGFLACIPIAGLMQLMYPQIGAAGIAGPAGLMVLLLVIAYFGFEVALLREQVRAMEKISAVTLSQTNIQRVIERFLQLSCSLISCDRASLWLTDDSQTKLERVARRYVSFTPLATAKEEAEREAVSVRFGEGLVGRVADRQSPLSVRDGARDPRSTQAENRNRTDNPYALLLLPLVTNGETVGVVQFERDGPGTYSSRDTMRIRSLAAQVAATISNVRLHRDIYTQAITDGLTGLYNRRYMQAALADERQRANRYGHTLSVIMLDVDGFKNYNDTYGHPQGDILLKMLAGLLRENVREVDLVGRYGGEEFIILMPETPKSDALRTAERLRTAVAAAVFPGFTDDSEMVVFKTISLGVATFPSDAEDMQALVQQADQALYRAKHGGRNQVVEATPTLEAVSADGDH